jgi:hypothetical protein
MPTGVRKNKAKCGARGWELYDKRTGEHKGCSTDKRKAHIAASIRDREAKKRGEKIQ